MTKIRFVEHSGKVHEIDAKDGVSVMRNALSHNIPGLDAECGGNLSCSTCHGFIDPQFYDQLPPPSENEKVMIECTVEPSDNSRLTCQVLVTPELEGMTVTWPESQY
jgi:2Fe-2S ferredoxin